MPNSDAAANDLSPELRDRLQRLHDELQEEREKRKKAEKALKDDHDLTVLEASKDLWRGHSEDRPPRSDTVRIDHQAEPAQQSEPSERDVLEAAVARSVGGES